MKRPHLNALALALVLVAPKVATSPATPTAELSQISAIAWSDDDRFLVTGDISGHVTAYDIKNSQAAWNWQGSSRGIYKIFFDKHKSAFIVAEQYGAIVLLKRDTGVKILGLQLDFPERDGKYIAGLQAASFDNDSETMVVSGSISPNTGLLIDLKKLSLLPGEQKLVLGSSIYWRHPPFIKGSTATSLVVDIKRQEPSSAAYFREFSPPGNSSISDISVCPGGKQIAGITDSGFLIAWSVNASLGEDQVKYVRKSFFEDRTEYLLDVTCGPSNQAVTTGSGTKYGTIQLWDGDGVLIAHYDTGSAGLIDLAVAFSSDGSILCSDTDLSYIFWKVQAAALVPFAIVRHTDPHRNGARAVFAFQHDAREIALTEGGAVILLDIESGVTTCVVGDCRLQEFRHRYRMLNGDQKIIN